MNKLTTTVLYSEEIDSADLSAIVRMSVTRMQDFANIYKSITAVPTIRAVKSGTKVTFYADDLILFRVWSDNFGVQSDCSGNSYLTQFCFALEEYLSAKLLIKNS